MVNLTINRKKVQVKEGTSILEAAATAGIRIPTLCYLKEINEIGACRVCVVEIKGKDTLVAACNTMVEEGMEVFTNSAKAIPRPENQCGVYFVPPQHELYVLCPERELFPADSGQ